MATWKVIAEAGTVEVDAPNWLGALGQALPRLGVGSGALGRLVCSVSQDGNADATDPQTGQRVRVEAVVRAAPPPLVMPASGLASMYASVAPSTSAAPEVALELDETEHTGGDEPERPSHPPPRPLEDRLFLVFDRCADIAGARTIQAACSTALNILSDLVPADAGAVLVRTRGGESLRFTAAFGPRANKILDTVVPVDQGIAGFSYNFSMALVVEDVRRDPRHNSRVDKSSGYRTRAIMAVPLTPADGAALGCLELLNPPEKFDGEDMEVAQVVAGSLAAWLQQAIG